MHPLVDFGIATCVLGECAGGGIGWGFQKHGFASDMLEWAEVVLPTAEGGAQLLRVDKDHHADLFWGLRGECMLHACTYPSLTAIDIHASCTSVRPMLIANTLNWTT